MLSVTVTHAHLLLGETFANPAAASLPTALLLVDLRRCLVLLMLLAGVLAAAMLLPVLGAVVKSGD